MHRAQLNAGASGTCRGAQQKWSPSFTEVAAQETGWPLAMVQLATKTSLPGTAGGVLTCMSAFALPENICENPVGASGLVPAVVSGMRAPASPIAALGRELAHPPAKWLRAQVWTGSCAGVTVECSWGGGRGGKRKKVR